jgi:hypothetical protein
MQENHKIIEERFSMEKKNYLKKALCLAAVMSAAAVPAFASPAVESNKDLAVAEQTVNAKQTVKACPQIKLEARYFAPKLTAEAKTDSIKMTNTNGIID